MSQLTTNTTTMQTILEKLQGKASGGSGASLNTCTIRIVCNTNDVYSYVYTKVIDGEVSMGIYEAASPSTATSIDVTLNDVLCGGFIFVSTNIEEMFIVANVEGEATTETLVWESSGMPKLAIYAPKTAGSQSTVTIIDND